MVGVVSLSTNISESIIDFSSHLISSLVPYQEAVARPKPSYMMTATVNPATNITYYYGGTPIDYVGSSFVSLV